jgi:Phospholipase_D-nuclease N-terminal
MLLFDGAFALLAFAVWVFCIIDVITTPESEIRNLPKLAWLLLVIILVDVGSIAWLIAGRPWNSRPADLPYKGNRGRQAEPMRRFNGTNPDDDEEFLAGLRARAEEQRRRAREAEQRNEEPPTPG